MNSETMKTLMGSESAEYLTPGWILDAVEKVAPIALDPCAHPKSESALRAQFLYMRLWARELALKVLGPDGLAEGWCEVGGLVFINPPYSRALKLWAAKMAAEPCPQIALVPARVDTGWWRRMNPDAWCALSGRVKFLSCQHEWGVTNRKGYHCQHCDQYADEPLETECPAAAPSETDPAPFPSAICLMHADAAMRARFVQVFKEHGPIYVRAD